MKNHSSRIHLSPAISRLTRLPPGIACNPTPAPQKHRFPPKGHSFPASFYRLGVPQPGIGSRLLEAVQFSPALSTVKPQGPVRPQTVLGVVLLAILAIPPLFR